MGKTDSQFCQVFPTHTNKFFDGVLVMIFGDFGQLAQVVGDISLFSNPKPWVTWLNKKNGVFKILSFNNINAGHMTNKYER